MRAVTPGQPGEVVFVEMPEPELGPGDVIISPTVIGICASDVKRVQKGESGTRYALGHEVAGVVVQADPAARWHAGEHIVCAPYLPCEACHYCRHGQPTLCPSLFDASLSPGGLADRVKIRAPLAARGTFLVPSGMPDELAALAEPVGCVIRGMHDAHLGPGDSALIIGDGPMGLIAAAVARAYGACPVIVAGETPHRLNVAQTNFADAVVNVRQSALRGEVERLTEGRGCDVVIVAVSSAEAFGSGLDAVRNGGVVNAFAGVPKDTTWPLDLHRLHYGQIHLTGSFGVAPADMALALLLMQSGRLDTRPLITARFPFEQTGAAVKYAADRTGLKAMVVFENNARDGQ